MLKMYFLNDEFKEDVGGKASSLNTLFKLDIPNLNVPKGFVLSSKIYSEFLTYNNLENSNKELILKSKFPEYIEKQIYEYFDFLNLNEVAVRSSAIGEDSKENSFAGQQDTYLNVTRENLISSIIQCYASLFNASAISYRSSRNLNSFQMAVVVQTMVRSDKGSSGVAFSIDTESGFEKIIIINSNFGLGESVVSGKVEPDEFIYFKETETIISKKKGIKDVKTIYGKELIQDVETTEYEKNIFSLDENNILKLGKLVKNIEKKYEFPIDVEWALDDKNELYIVQVRPITTCKKDIKFKKYKLLEIFIPFLTGIAVGQKIGTGKVSIKESLDLNFKEGDVLVAKTTTPDWEIIMKKASAIIVETGGRTSHAAIVSRELNIPSIVGCKDCLTKLKEGENITVECNGEIGKIYKGILKYKIEEIDLSDLEEKVNKLPLKIKINAGLPDVAFSNAFLPTKGVGLTRLEFIISSLRIHPNALLKYDTLSKEVKSKIDDIVKKEDKLKYYIDGISNGVSKIAASVYPNEVIVRFSDFKTNEYRSLIGGEIFEPFEESSMLGWRGASRYYSDNFKECFKLECKAIEDVINKKKLKNISIMIPFCRTIEELLKVKEILKEFSFKNIKLYLMCEIPSNVILANEFSQHVDGFSIGSNDLTQLTLGIDRDNSNLVDIGDERNLAVKKSISKVIKKAHKNNVTIGLCGNGVSNHIDFASFLMKEGIDSISITPDVFIKTVNLLYNIYNKK
jgi:pyruvate, water dikinase